MPSEPNSPQDPFNGEAQPSADEVKRLLAYEIGLQLNRQAPMDLRWYALDFKNQGDLDKAARCARKSVELVDLQKGHDAETRFDCYQCLAWVLEERGDFQEAEQLLSRAYKLADEAPLCAQYAWSAATQMESVLKAQGRKEEAKEWGDKAWAIIETGVADPLGLKPPEPPYFFNLL